MENLKQQIEEIEAQQEELAKKKGELQQQIAELACPFKVGDVGTVSSWSHNGKKGKITKVIYDHYWKWNIVVSLFKKDGTVGDKQATIYLEKHFSLDGVK